MALIKGGKLVADRWPHLDDEEEDAGEAPVIVSLARWRRDAGTLAKRSAPLGIRLSPADDPGEIADALDSVDLIALDFPRFSDGRAYSQARILREHHHFAGELRAIGDVQRDQLSFMARCGFDAFAVADSTTPADFQAALEVIGVVMQPAADTRLSAIRLRHPGAAPGPSAKVA